MTPPSSSAEPPTTRKRGRSLLAGLRRRWRLAVSLGVVLLFLIAGLVALAYHQGFFVRGPAADAATAFITDVQRRDYAAAYALLAPDLTAHETKQAFAAEMDAFRQADGSVTSFAAREMNSDGGRTVIGFDVSRSIRGSFTVHISLEQGTSGKWLITGVDDL
jgi:hypothetical protein